MQLNITAQFRQKAMEAINLEKQGKTAEAKKIKDALLSELVNGGGSQSAFVKSKYDPQASNNSNSLNITPDEAIKAATALKALGERGINTQNYSVQDLLEASKDLEVEAFLDNVFGSNGAKSSGLQFHTKGEQGLDSILDNLYGPKLDNTSSSNGATLSGSQSRSSDEQELDAILNNLYGPKR